MSFRVFIARLIPQAAGSGPGVSALSRLKRQVTEGSRSEGRGITHRGKVGGKEEDKSSSCHSDLSEDEENTSGVLLIFPSTPLQSAPLSTLSQRNG